MKKHEAKQEKRDITISRSPVVSSHEVISPLTKIEREMLSTLNEMERWFEDALHRPFLGFHRLPLAHLLGERRSGDFIPSVDMFEEGGELVIKAELAGVKREDIKIELSGNTLTLTGEKRGGEKVQQKDFFRVEQSYGAFSRTLELPEGVRLEEIKASYKDGLLDIRIPKSAATVNIRTVPISE